MKHEIEAHVVDSSAVVVQNAAFNPVVRYYILLQVALVLMVSIVGIPLAIIWVCGVGQWYSRLFLKNLACTLTNKTLSFRFGILVHVDKTIPLENIQDVTFYEGPLLRRFRLAMLRVETAGQSDSKGNEMSLVGIVDAHAFRERVLQQRDLLKQQARSGAGGEAQTAALLEIRDVLLRIEARLPGAKSSPGTINQ